MKPVTTRAMAVLALATAGAIFLLASRAAAVDAVYPVEKAHQSFVRSVCSRIRGLFRGAAAEAENAVLRREIAALSLVRGECDELRAENERLRRSLAYASRTGFEWIPAGVLSRDGGAAGVRRTFRIDKGMDGGVAVGAVVVVPDGLVGCVTAVSHRTAEVTLVTDPHLKVACAVESTGGRAVPCGLTFGGDVDRLELRRSGASVRAAPGSRVVTSGLGGVYPRGLVVGTYLPDGGILPAVDYSVLEDVFVRRAK